MITVTIRREHDQRISSFQVSGHANSGPYGYDLVCAGVSAITFGSINAILALCEKHLSIDQANDKGGYLHVYIPPIHEKKLQSYIKLLFYMMYISILIIVCHLDNLQINIIT